MDKKTIEKALKLHSKGEFEKAIGTFSELIDGIDIVNYLLIGRKNDIPKETISETYYNIGVCYKEWAERLLQGISHKGHHTPAELFEKAIESFRQVLVLNTVHKNASTNLVSIFSTLCSLNNNNVPYCISRLQDALFYDPCSPIVHYNLGFMFTRANRLEASIIHYRLAIKLSEGNDPVSCKLRANCYYGISCVYRTIKQWPEALYYSLGGAKIFPRDPDINNQLGVIYTEMRRTDLAQRCYEIAIRNATSHFISTDTNQLLSDIHLNFGQMYSYNGDTHRSIECYNRSLDYNPKAILAFQNKIMNLNYISNELSDKMWILTQHKLINKLIPPRDYHFQKRNVSKNFISIGFVSGDFIDHPVSFFLNGLLREIDKTKFKVYLYSENVVDMAKFREATRSTDATIVFSLIKNKTTEEVFNLIANQHDVDILIDLSGHTAFNRLDVFNYRCAPIQITWLGYPNTTGLVNMDYRLTDSVSDPPGKTERYYTEKLIRLPNCFLNYTTGGIPEGGIPEGGIPEGGLPGLTSQPFLKNGFITFGCYNRLNKISPEVIECWKKLLERIPDCRIRFKTKALLNKKVISNFLDNFGEHASRIDIVECTTSHEKHLLSYNEIDIALDTFPYSGTTTSCEALMMGVPVFTLRDNVTYFHAQNVTCSLLENSSNDLSFYICDSVEEMCRKCKRDFDWENLKKSTRESFLNGKVCDAKGFANDFETTMEKLLRI
jgi:protein O-GlcNAc transferase